MGKNLEKVIAQQQTASREAEEQGQEQAAGHQIFSVSRLE